MNRIGSMKRVRNMNTRKVPVDTHAQFKAYCARRGYSMQAAIIALMQKAVLENMPLPEARK